MTPESEHIHVVGDLQYHLDRLGLKVPRALCGVLLAADADEPDPPADAATCVRCADLAGWQDGRPPAAVRSPIRRALRLLRLIRSTTRVDHVLIERAPQ